MKMGFKIHWMEYSLATQMQVGIIVILGGKGDDPDPPLKGGYNMIVDKARLDCEKWGTRSSPILKKVQFCNPCKSTFLNIKPEVT